MRKAFRELSRSERFHRRSVLLGNTGNDENTRQKRTGGNVKVDSANREEGLKADVTEEMVIDIDESIVQQKPELDYGAGNLANNESRHCDSEDGYSEPNTENGGNNTTDNEQSSDVESLDDNNASDSNIESQYINVSDCEGDENEIPRSRYKESLYRGDALTVEHSLLLVLALVLKHNLTGSCIEDILTVIHLHCIAQD